MRRFARKFRSLAFSNGGLGCPIRPVPGNSQSRQCGHMEKHERQRGAAHVRHIGDDRDPGGGCESHDGKLGFAAFGPFFRSDCFHHGCPRSHWSTFAPRAANHHRHDGVEGGIASQVSYLRKASSFSLEPVSHTGDFARSPAADRHARPIPPKPEFFCGRSEPLIRSRGNHFSQDRHDRPIRPSRQRYRRPE